MKLGIAKKEKVIGIADKRREYDLPLVNSPGNNFLMILVSLMTFLALLMVLSFFLLTSMTKNWSSGLQNHITIEIPAQDKIGAVLSKDLMDSHKEQIARFLKTQPAVEHVEIMSNEDVTDLVRPWLGDNLALSNLALPALISVRLKKNAKQDLNSLEQKIKSLVSHARIDTHQSWLNDLLRFTGALQLAAIILALFVGVTITVAIISAIRSRMAEHKDDIELLHLMGASDQYIAGQLQRHSALLATKGGLLGLILGLIVIFIIKLALPDAGSVLLPQFKLTTVHYLTLGLLPFIAGLIAFITTRQTVIYVLSKMP